MYMCIYIYIYIYNLHLGLINAPLPNLFFPPNDLFSLFIYYQKGQKYIKFWPRLC